MIQWQRILLQCTRYRCNPSVRKIPWSRKWPPTTVFLPGLTAQTEKPGRLQSTGHKELDTTEVTKQQLWLHDGQGQRQGAQEGGGDSVVQATGDGMAGGAVAMERSGGIQRLF